jgi:hypothetical protein
VDVSTQGFGRLGQAIGAIGLPTLVVQEEVAITSPPLHKTLPHSSAA